MTDELDRFLANARGSAASAKIMSLDELRARRGVEQPGAHRWGLTAIRGRLVELSARGATATLTAAIELVGEAQQQAEPVAWVTLGTGTFYPPDVAESGIDLAALVVIRAPDAISVARSAERVLRSGAFGLVVLDLVGGGAGIVSAAAELSMQVQGRLVTLAQAHDAAIVCITDKPGEAASLGSLVSLRAEALRRREPAEFAVTVRVLKDKRRGPGWSQTARRRGPAGMT